MGMQSSRILFGGTDSKDIIFNGKYHKQMFLGSQLVWEKIEDASDTFKFTIIETSGFYLSAAGKGTIDWGDGTSQQFTNGYWGYHEYSNPNSYTITVVGDFRVDTYELFELKEVLTPYNVSTIEYSSNAYGFWGDDALERVPSNLLKNFPDLEIADWLFYSCWNLQEIPTGLFDVTPKLKSTSYTFAVCNEIKSIPQGLFARCPDLESIEALFFNSDNIESIPSTMLHNNAKLKNVNSAFEIVNLKEIPQGLFANCPELESANGTFQACYGLESIPQDIFANNPNINDLEMCFYLCKNVTSAVPELWLTHPNANHGGCFYGCTKAANYDEIPDDWKQKPY